MNSLIERCEEVKQVPGGLYNAAVKVYSSSVCELSSFKISKEVDNKMRVKKGEAEEGKKVNNRYRALLRAASRVRELIIENELIYHWSLTFAAEVVSREEALKEFKKFIQRLDYAMGHSVKYVAVMEIQKKREKNTGQAVWHFHLATDEYIKHKIMADAWKNGHVLVKRHTGKDAYKVAAYLSKYLKKDLSELHIENKKRYMHSTNLREPEKRKLLLTEQEKKRIIDKASVVVEFDNLTWLRLDSVEDLKAAGNVK